MPLSNFTGFTPIAERSEATPGLFNARFQQTQDNVLSLYSSVQSSLVSVGGLSSNTLVAESGSTVRVNSDFSTANDWFSRGTITLKSESGAVGMDIRTGDAAAAGILFKPNADGGADVYGQAAVTPRGSGLADSARASFRVFNTDVDADEANYESVGLESHNDADGATRYRIATRVGGTGEHRPFYFQIGGQNAASIDTVAGVFVSSPATNGGFSWITTGSARGDIVVGANAGNLLAVNSDNTGTHHIVGNDNSNRVRIDSTGNTVVAGTVPVQLTDSSGSLVAQVLHKRGAYSAGSETPNVRDITYMHIANASATRITNFVNGGAGQILGLTFGDANTGITRDNAYLRGGSVFTGEANGTLLLLKGDGGNWHELSRETNQS